MRRFIQGGLILGSLLFVVGCAGKADRHEAVSGLLLIKEPTAAIWVSDADVYRANGQLVVTGKVRTSHNIREHGHVDVFLTTSGGEVVKKVIEVPGVLSKRSGVAKLAFKAVFNQLPEDGSTVNVRYHRGSAGCAGDAKSNI